jgi:hypothetical protein
VRAQREQQQQEEERMLFSFRGVLKKLLMANLNWISVIKNELPRKNFKEAP